MLTSVEVPLKLKKGEKEEGKKKIVKMLGGEDMIRRVLQREGGRFELSLNPDTTNEHRLLSNPSKSKKKRVLVRMGNPPTVVGVVENTHVFQNPSDIQYFESGKRKRKIAPPEELKSEGFFLFNRAPILPLPHRFLEQTSLTLNQTILSNYRKRQQKVRGKKEPKSMSTVPAMKRKKISDEYAKKVKKYGVDKIFEKHPVWSSQGLHEITNENFLGNLTLRKLVSFYGTYTQGGPWGRLWIRNNYDPTTTKDSRVYQSIRFDIRITLNSVSPVIREKFGERVESLQLNFMGRTLKAQNFYCINEVCKYCNKIKHIVQSAPIRDKVDGTQGWFYTDTFTAIHNTMKREAVKQFQNILYVGDDFKPEPSLVHEEDGKDENLPKSGEEEEEVRGFALLGDSESDGSSDDNE